MKNPILKTLFENMNKTFSSKLFYYGIKDEAGNWQVVEYKDLPFKTVQDAWDCNIEEVVLLGPFRTKGRAQMEIETFK
jgi:hypothetical protein